MPSGIDVIFLGTGGALPTRERGLPSVAVRRNGELVLFDCGEGTQRQMMHAGLGFSRPTSIFISHLHGDHLLGLPGLLQTMSSLVRDKPLELYGPKGLSSFLNALRTTLGFQSTFPLRTMELSPGAIVKKSGYQIRAILAKHDITCLAYGLVEDVRPGHFHPNVARRLGLPEGPLWKDLQYGKTVSWDGRKIRPKEVMGPTRAGLKLVYAIDTRPAESVKRLAQGCDLLIHDGGFTLDRKDKAREYYHSTGVEAAGVAKASKSKRLALVHISAVTRDDRILLREARKVFRNTLVPKDLTVLSLKRSA
jgi:ribonuclease Z